MSLRTPSPSVRSRDVQPGTSTVGLWDSSVELRASQLQLKTMLMRVGSLMVSSSGLTLQFQILPFRFRIEPESSHRNRMGFWISRAPAEFGFS
ncbi:MAG: hypothetical protein QOH71_707 [Blastocatellia bacterium]|jgi:hypothetical protein|nr:hypothetical protein [Blastocatellia bacterium]